MKIEVVAGDVFAVEGVEALVNPANRQASMRWGSHVNEQLRKRGGPQLVAEREAAGEVALGDVVVGRAGALPYRYILHAAVLDMFDINPLFLLKLKERTSQATLERAMRGVLARCEELGIGSVAMTPMGAGIGGMSMERCAAVILEVLGSWSGEAPERVVIACLKEKDAAVFRQTLTR